MKAENDYKKQIRELQYALETERRKNTAMAKGLIPKEYLHNYARIQIEKDRDRVKEEFNQDPFISIEKVHNNTPINLD